MSDGVASLLRVVRTQLVMLHDAHARGQQAPALTGTTLDLLLQALVPVIAERQQAPATTEAEKKELAELQSLITAHAQSTVQLSSHLIEIAQGWTCPHCGTDVAEGAAVSDGDRGASFLGLFLICAECGERSRPAEAGRKVFVQRFGHLAKPGWNPAQNGFVVDRSVHARSS